MAPITTAARARHLHGVELADEVAEDDGTMTRHLDHAGKQGREFASTMLPLSFLMEANTPLTADNHLIYLATPAGFEPATLSLEG
jgi:hypothetical protein